jgi:virginiamycin B lyase
MAARRTLRNLSFVLSIGFIAAVKAQSEDPHDPKALQLPLESLKPAATFTLGGAPDWMVITPHAVWVSNAKLKAVQRIDPAGNKLVATIPLPDEPCSGLAFAFGSVWAPLCGAVPSLARIDPSKNRITAVVAVGPADSEGGIAASHDSIWMVTGKNGTLSRIDPATNAVRQRTSIAPGSFNPLFCAGQIWVTGFESNALIAVNAVTGKVLARTSVGPKPRFLTCGSGSIWTLNQGDGSISRVDARTRKLIATIQAGIPGAGGEISYGADSIWATVFKVPLTRIDARSNRVARQWIGQGGDSVRFSGVSIWLTDYHRGLLWRIPAKAALGK